MYIGISNTMLPRVLTAYGWYKLASGHLQENKRNLAMEGYLISERWLTLLLFYPTNRDHERVDAVPLVVVAAPVGPDQVEGLKVQAEKADVFFLKKSHTKC